jgi:hypothetical protein
MKPLFILVKHDGAPMAAINSQDIKLIHIKRGSPNKVIVTLSHSDVSVQLTDYAVDKIKKEMRDRYTMATLNSRGLDWPAQGKRDKKNVILVVHHDNDSEDTYIFPKALKKVVANGNKIAVHNYGQSLEVTLQPARAAIDQGLPLLAFSTEES